MIYFSTKALHRDPIKGFKGIFGVSSIFFELISPYSSAIFPSIPKLRNTKKQCNFFYVICSNTNSTSPPPVPSSTSGNTVTITPIPKHQVKNHHTNFPMRSELPGGVQISMVVPLPQQSKDTMKLSLDDIIIAGLERQPEETNYKCTKAFAEQFDQPVPRKQQPTTVHESGGIPGSKRHSLDTEHGSPGDSDYESSQEVAAASGLIPFKIRKNSSVTAAIKKTGDVPANISTPASIDSRIQKSIKDFFITS